MKEINGKLTYKEKEYNVVFNLNVMQEIQEKYGTINKWADLTEGKGKEPDAKAIIFGFTAMLNEGLDIENEETGSTFKPLTEKQVGRILTEIGFNNANEIMQKTVIESTKTEQKNV